MRTPWGFVLLCVAICACGGDEGTNPSVFDAPPRADAPLAFDAPPVDGRTFDGPVSAFDARGPDARVGEAPVIRNVIITQSQPCTQNTPSAVTVEIVATDVETPPANLTYSGSCSSCGTLTARVTTFSCPQAAPYPCNATVQDPDNNQATTSFVIRPCENNPDAGP